MISELGVGAAMAEEAKARVATRAATLKSFHVEEMREVSGEDVKRIVGDDWKSL